MTLHAYETLGGKNLILDYINSLSKDEIVDGLSVLKNLEDGKIESLTIKQWRGQVNEVYFYRHNRIFYIVVDGKDAYLLHTCRKQKDKTEQKDADIIVKRTKELETALSRKFI